MVCATFNTILLSYDCDTVCSLVVPKSEKICQILDTCFCEHLEVFGAGTCRNLRPGHSELRQSGPIFVHLSQNFTIFSSKIINRPKIGKSISRLGDTHFEKRCQSISKFWSFPRPKRNSHNSKFQSKSSSSVVPSSSTVACARARRDRSPAASGFSSLAIRITPNAVSSHLTAWISRLRGK